MATINYYLDSRRALKNGCSPLKIAIRNAGSAAFIKTNHSIPADCWDGEKVVKGASADKLRKTPVALNRQLKEELALIQSQAYAVMAGRVNLPAAVIRDLLQVERGDVAATKGTTIIGLLEELSERKSVTCTYGKSFLAVAEIVRRTTRGADKLTVDVVDENWAALFIAEARKKVSDNTLISYIQKLKSAFNLAAKRGHRNAAWIFEGMKVKKNPVRIRVMDVEDFRKVWNYTPKGTEYQKDRMQMSLDALKLSFCLCGMNIKDIAMLTDKDVINGRIEVERHKTGIPLSIKLEPEALELIARLRVGDKLAGVLADKWLYDVRSINYHLNKVCPGLTTYYARHCWATYACDLDLPDRVIALGLGHSYGNAITERYIRKSYNKLDKANRMVLDYVLGKAEKD